jgi:hypothetical protein
MQADTPGRQGTLPSLSGPDSERTLIQPPTLFLPGTRRRAGLPGVIGCSQSLLQSVPAVCLAEVRPSLDLRGPSETDDSVRAVSADRDMSQ